jgi:hypothetical protein
MDAKNGEREKPLFDLDAADDSRLAAGAGLDDDHLPGSGANYGSDPRHATYLR